MSKSSLIIGPLLCTQPLKTDLKKFKLDSHQNYHQFSWAANVVVNILGEERVVEKKSHEEEKRLWWGRECVSKDWVQRKRKR